MVEIYQNKVKKSSTVPLLPILVRCDRVSRMEFAFVGEKVYTYLRIRSI